MSVSIAQTQQLPTTPPPSVPFPPGSNPGQVTTTPSKGSTIVKNMALFGGIGAVAGFAATFLPLPIVGGFAAPIGALIGGAIGAAIGLVTGLVSNRSSARNEPPRSMYQDDPSVVPPPPPTGVGGLPPALPDRW